VPRSIDHCRSPHPLLGCLVMVNCGRFTLVCSLGILAAVVGGCQRGSMWNTTSVEGTITKGGRPLQSIEVIFLVDLEAGGQGLRSIGLTNQAGYYRLRASNGEDGAGMGKYRVLVHDLEANKQQMLALLRGPQRGGKSPQPLPEAVRWLDNELKTSADLLRVPTSYGRFNETPLRAEVGREPLVFDIAIP
jgi:hypothetical protein